MQGPATIKDDYTRPAATRLKWSFCLLALLAGSSGCTLAVSATRNLAYETKRCAGELVENCRNDRLAAAAWAEVRRDGSGHELTTAYGRGFKAGYADTLEAGGYPSAPSLPPKCRWRPRPEGPEAIREWLAGYHHGATVASSRGPGEVIDTPYLSSHSKADAAPHVDAKPAPPPVTTGKIIYEETVTPYKLFAVSFSLVRKINVP